MKIFKFSVFILLLILSCSKEKDTLSINSRPNADFTYSDSIDHFVLYDNSKDSDGDILTSRWISKCDTIKIFNPFSSKAYFNYPQLSDAGQLKIKLVVNDGRLSDSVTKEISLAKPTLARLYGLGIDLKEEHSNNVDYNWYYDQMNTGSYASVNCGPASVTMAIKWAKKDFNKTPEDARNAYRPNGGWWYTNDIINYLNEYSINNYTIRIDQINLIRDEINSGNIAVLCLDMYFISSQKKDKWHIDKFYSTNSSGWGHFIVIKGYKKVDDEIYYQAYDPYSFGMKYINDTLKGIDRYYRSEDLHNAVSDWWNYAIIVSKSNLKGSNLGVDVSKIIHKSGL